MAHHEPLRLCVAIAALVLAAPWIAAGAASPEEGGSVLYCTPATSEFRIASSEDHAPAQSYGGRRAFDASALITVDPKVEMRTGSQSKQLQCGDIAIEVRGGFYNANPQGELGAADDFVKLTIARRANRVDVSLVPDACADALSPRAQAAWGANPVQAIEGRRVGGAYQITLFKTACDASGNGKPVTQVLTWP